MSTTVDQRVVEMRFDNRQFESNVSTTMSTLDKFKQRLNLTGASRGLENVGAAANKLNFSMLGNAIETVQAKFSALQVVGVTTLANITNSAVNAGKRIVSALTIDPIKTGLSEYETQINAVQTILANTESKGTTLGQVNNALDELNKYADMTIYNFTEMTRNIGTFTAAGVDLNTSVNAIKGIANLAAVSGSSSQQASVAMYQLSQALSSGTVKLMDWNSVVNAGMGGQVFQDALKETARVHGVAIDDMIKKNGSFRETLQEGWLTADILTETLSHFTMAAEEGSKEWETYKKSLIDDGYTEEQALAILKLSNTATNAATKVKTATQLWDTLKETAQSGWTQTWEIILGDFGEAKELFTGIYETLAPIIETMSEARNKLLSEGLSSGWKQLMGEGIADEEGYRDSIKEVAKEHGVAIDDMIKAEKELDSSLSDSDAFQKALSKGLSDGTINSDMLTKSVTHLADKMRNMTDAEREAAGYTEDHIIQIEKLEKGLKDGSISMDEFVKKMNRPSGRENLIQALLNGFNGLMSMVEPIKTAFSEVFPAITGEQVYQLTERIRKFSENLTMSAETADKVKRIFKGVFSIFDIGKKIIGNIGKAFLDLAKSSGISSFSTMVLDSLASLGDWFTSLNKEFDTSGLSGTLSTAVSGISNFIGIASDKIQSFGDILSTIGSFISSVCSDIWEGIKTTFSWFSENFSAGDVFAGLAGGGIFVAAKKIAGLIKKINESFDGGLFGFLFGGGDKKDSGGLKDKISELFDGIGEAFESFSSSVKTVSFVAIAASIMMLSSAFEKISGLDAEDIAKSLVTMGVALGEMAGGLKILGGSSVSMGTSLAMLALAEACNILGDAMEKFSKFSWDEIGRGLAGMGGALGEMVAALSVLSKVGGFGSILGGTGLLIAVQSLSDLAKGLEDFADMSWDEIGRGLAGMGGALGEMTIALAVLSKVGGFGSMLGGTGILIAVQSLSDLAAGLKEFATMNWPEIGRGLAGMGGALGEVGLVLGLLGKFAGFSSIFASGAILIVVQGLGDLATYFKDFAGMAWDEIGRGFVAMGAALGEVALTVGVLGKLAGFSSIFASGAILIVVQGLGDLASAFKEFAGMDWGEIGRGFVGMGAALGEVAGITGLLGVFGGFSSIFASGAILIVVQGLGDLAGAFSKFGGMSWEEIGRGVVGMGAALGEVALITGALGALAGLPALLGGGAILLAVQGLGDLADALKQFADMSWDEIGNGLAAMGGALGEVALGSLLNTFSGFGAGAISEMAAPLGILADSVKKWENVSVPEGLSANLSSLATGVEAFTLGGWGASALAEAAPGVGAMADSVKKWADVTVPEGITEGLRALADGVYAFTFTGLGAGALADSAPGVATMADSVSKWSKISVPENLGSTLESLGAGVKAFTFGGSGASSLSEAAPGVASMADSVTKWIGLEAPTDLGTNLSALATGVKAFTFGGSGAGTLTEAAPGVGTMADSVKKWIGIEVPADLGTNLSTLATGVKSFNFGGSGASAISTVASSIGTMADSVKKWTDVTVPTDLATNLGTLATGVKEFTFGGSGADSLTAAAPGVGAMADSVKKWAGVTVPEGLSTQLTSLATVVSNFAAIDDIGYTADEVSRLSSAVSSLSKIAFGTIKTGLIGISNAITDLNASSSAASGLGNTIYEGLVGPLKNAADSMSSVGSDIISKIDSGIKSKQGSLTSTVNSVATSAATAIKSKSGEFSSAGETCAGKFATGLEKQSRDVSNAAKSVASKAVSGAKENYSSMITAGSYMGQGFIEGVNSKMGDAYLIGYALGLSGKRGLEDALRIASPSKVTTQDGKYFGIGFVNGLKTMTDSVYDATLAMGDDAAKGLSRSVSNISSIVSNDINANPTIRPILDLSDIRAGAGAIDGMLNSNPLSLMTNVGAISSTMSRRGQNGADSEVVTAIDKLRRDISNMPRESYSINGITYDDGSNVANAMREIVRAARTERRV